MFKMLNCSFNAILCLTSMRHFISLMFVFFFFFFYRCILTTQKPTIAHLNQSLTTSFRCTSSWILDLHPRSDIRFITIFLGKLLVDLD